MPTITMAADTKRLIDANALMEDIEACRGGMFHSAIEREIDDNKIDFALDAVREAPTIEAEPVRHGRWMWEGRFKACSLCGSYIDWDDTLGANHWKFCPYCSAKMT